MMSDRDPRAEEMLRDPKGYFKRAREEARRLVERDMERERQLAKRRRVTHDNLPDEPFSFVGAPTPRRRLTMPATQPRKAVAAFVLTFLGTLLASLQGRKEFAELTLLEWIIVIGTALVTTGVVYGITNPPTR